MKYHYFEQGSEEWLQARLGIPTASEFDRIVTPARLEPCKSGGVATKYMHRKLAEWMMGAPLEAFVSPWMERGKNLEAEAVRYYEMECDVETSAVGFVTTDDGMIGASPDRLVGADGLLELKCPALETHVGYMLDPESLYLDYRLQVQGQMWVCGVWDAEWISQGGRQWCDIVSYYPGFPAVVRRVLPQESVQKALGQHIPAFVNTMLKGREQLTQAYGELRRERVTAAQRVEASRAAFDEFMNSPIGGNV